MNLQTGIRETTAMKSLHTEYRMFFVVLTTVLGLCITADSQELYLAIEDADLYKDHVLAKVLNEDLIVQGQRNSADHNWLTVMYDNRQYNARRKNFRSRAEVEQDHLEKIAGLESALTELDRRIDFNQNRILDLRLAAATVRFDSTFSYRVTVVTARRYPAHPPKDAPADDDDDTQPQGATDGGERRQLQVRYVDRVSPSRARRLAEEWHDDADELEEENEKLREKRRDALLDKTRLEIDLKNVDRRFERFAADGQSYRINLYLTVRDRVPLYDGNRLVGELAEDSIVAGMQNVRFDRWLRIFQKEKLFDSRSRYYQPEEEVSREYVMRSSSLRQTIDETESRINAVENYAEILRARKLFLDYRSHITEIPARTWTNIMHMPQFGRYSVTPRPADAVIVLRSSRARRLERDWVDRLQKLDRQVTTLRKDLTEQRKTLAGLGPRYKGLMRWFEQKEKQLNLTTGRNAAKSATRRLPGNYTH